MKPILLIDLDKTTFENQQREHLVPDDPTVCSNWDEWALACDTDTPIHKWISVVETLAATRMYQPVFLTSSSEVCRDKTEALIAEHMPVVCSQIKGKDLIMRSKNDHGTPSQFKMQKIEDLGAENIAFALDDDPKVCAMMIGMGIAVLNVNPPKVKPDVDLILCRGAQKIRRALGKEMMNHLNVSQSEILADSDEYLSFTVEIETKDNSLYFDKLKNYVQIDYIYDDDEYHMIFGEDNQADITRGNLFEHLFYAAVCHAEI